MNKIVVDWEFPKALIILWCVAIFYGVVAWLYVHDNAKQMSMLAALFVGLLALSTYFISRQPKLTEIDIQNDKVIKRYRSVFGISKTKRYSLKSFYSVRSYFTVARNTVNAVKLIAKGGKESVQIARFSPMSTADTGTLGTRKFTEAEDATSLRKKISKDCALVNDGFVGFEWSFIKEMRDIKNN